MMRSQSSNIYNLV